jgi:cysteine desulfurase
LFHTDAVQAAGKIPIDVRAAHVDMLSLSGHKIHAPKGIGVLYVKKKIKFFPMATKFSWILLNHEHFSKAR